MRQKFFLDKTFETHILERYPGRVIASVLLRRIKRRLLSLVGSGRMDPERIVLYNGLAVFDTPVLHGEGITVGADYLRALLSLGLSRCTRIFEFCAGPGYIGYSLLANGFCEHLTLADINPEAVALARKTAELNNIEHLVTIYQSDVLDQIPSEEQWDLVVSNPPHFLPLDEGDRSIRAFDPDWLIHRSFYANVKPFMKPGGLIVMQENGRGSRGDGSTPDLFVPMIEAGGGEYLSSIPEKDVCGHSNGMYYMVSRW